MLDKIDYWQKIDIKIIIYYANIESSLADFVNSLYVIFLEVREQFLLREKFKKLSEEVQKQHSLRAMVLLSGDFRQTRPRDADELNVCLKSSKQLKFVIVLI